MKKMAKMMLVFAFAFLVFAGCSKQTTWILTINNDGVYSVVSYPQFTGTSSFGWQEGQEGEKSHAEFSVSKDGETTMVVQDEAGKEYAITIICKDGKVDVKTDDGISVDLQQK